MKYRIYRNLSKQTYSLQTKVGGRWKVTNHCKEFAAQNCVFKVYESGRQRVIKNKRKNVHAFLLCEEVIISLAKDLDKFPRISYDPYQHETFMREGKPISESKLVYLGPNGLHDLGDNL